MRAKRNRGVLIRRQDQKDGFIAMNTDYRTRRLKLNQRPTTMGKARASHAAQCHTPVFSNAATRPNKVKIASTIGVRQTNQKWLRGVRLFVIASFPKEANGYCNGLCIKISLPGIRSADAIKRFFLKLKVLSPCAISTQGLRDCIADDEEKLRSRLMRTILRCVVSRLLRKCLS